MEASPYFVVNDPNLPFNPIYCRECEEPENKAFREELLNAEKIQITICSNFIEKHNAKLTALVEKLPEEDIVGRYTILKGVSHLSAWKERFQAVVDQALGLQSKILEANRTEKKCEGLFAKLKELKESCKKLEDELCVEIDLQRKFILMTVSFNPQEEEMPELDPSQE